ncbi:phosphate ABC transporter substrate-binding protein PstS [Nocardia sp. NRRL WC-3656]|uniref:phosphate ABC transporter substrate-binding protein PstS n=1 Tax=Nocardia sp. NRRL WC-3656 TaxID=1463824 RepID=UPI0005624E9B|nr:phosphate ABC transporter substrate-binding protein PstS [Nocardia sp. NRRL WC-3656]
MFRKSITAAVVALTATGLAACGSTSDVGGGNTTQEAQAGQICGQAAAAKPGYQRAIAKLDGGASTLSGAGSTFVAPVMSVWTKNYSSEGVQVAYQSIGSGGGVQQISADTVDFGASDTPMKDDELAKAKNGPILHIPLTLGAVIPTYNVKGVKTGLKFDGDTLGKIFAGKITKWNDAALTALNPGTALPDEPIAVAHRSDGSGTTAVWTDYLTKESPTWVSTLGGADKSFGKDIAWPVGLGGKGNEGVSGVVNQTEGAIGYVELAYALAQNLNYGQVKNKAGNFVQPCIATITKGTDGITYPADLRTSLTDGPDANAFPITGTTYALVYQNQTDSAHAKALVNFLSWTLSTGQDQAADVNYAPLGKDLQQLAVNQVKKITLNGAPLAS